METASFNGLIKAIFILFLVYYGLKFLMRLLAPVIVQEVVKKAEQNFNRQAGHNPQYNNQDAYRQPPQQPKRTEMPKEKKKVGEYIDFEELD
jgi:hypothetical protein